jgi:LysM repeat protein
MIAKNTSHLQLRILFLASFLFGAAGCSLFAPATSDGAGTAPATTAPENKPEPAAATPSPGLTVEPSAPTVTTTPEPATSTVPAAVTEPASGPSAAPDVTPASAPVATPEPALIPEADAPVTSTAKTKATTTRAVRTRSGVKDVPEKYVVKKGDTLWGIANHFLKDPWMWPEVWQVNPRIRNPHLIYPGDVIAMHYVDGKPVLILDGTPLPTSRGPAPSKTNLPVVKLGPTARTDKLQKAVASLPKQVIAPFLNRPYLLGRDDLDDAPYIVSSLEEHLVNGSGGRVYAKGLLHTTLSAFVVVRPGPKYIDPDNGEVLGFEAINLADSTLVSVGDEKTAATLTINKARQEVINGDYLIPVEKENIDLNFFPRAPKQKIRGQIISVYQGVSKIGQYNVVVLNRGEEHGLESGHVLEVFQAGTKVRDPYDHSKITLPEERAGILMVFRTYRKVSFALVMAAEREMRVLDAVVSP